MNLGAGLVATSEWVIGAVENRYLTGDAIGVNFDLDLLYSVVHPDRTSCKMGAKQRMFIKCPNLSPKDVNYFINDIEIAVLLHPLELRGTRICRDKGDPV